MENGNVKFIITSIILPISILNHIDLFSFLFFSSESIGGYCSLSNIIKLKGKNPTITVGRWNQVCIFRDQNADLQQARGLVYQ